MKIISSLRNILEKGFKRFLFPLIWLFLTFASTVCLIFELPDEFFAYFTLSLVLSVFLSLFCVLLSERFKLNKVKSYIIQLAPAMSAFGFYFLLRSESVYCYLAYIGILVSAMIASVILLFGENNRNTLVPYLIKNIAMATLVAVIVFAGLLICLLAFDYLIFELDNFDDLLLTVLSFSFCLVFGTFFISSVPEIDSELTVPKAFRIIFLYAAFPIYILLLAVLYIYFIKIIATWSIPGGQLNWFASFAELFFVLFGFTIMQYESKITRLWQKIGGYLLLPVIAFQAIAVFIRVSAYGLTTSRWVSILLSLVATVFVVLSLIKEGKHRNVSLYVLLGVMLVSTLTPLSFIDVPVFEQNARLNALLEKNGMINGDEIVSPSDISEKDADAILESFEYLKYVDSRYVPDYVENNDRYDFEALIKSEPKIELTDYTHIYFYSDSYFEDGNTIDISKYSTLAKIYHYGESNDFVVSVLGKEYDLKDQLGGYEKDPTEAIIIAECDGMDFYITYLDYDRYLKNGEVVYDYVAFEGYALAH